MKTITKAKRCADRKRQQGSVSILVAVSLAVLLGVAGLAVDSGLGYMIKARLDAAVDGAVIAAGEAVTRGANQAEQTTNAIQAANSFFAANYPAGYLGSSTTLGTPSIVFNKGTVTIDLAAQAQVPVTFMKTMGFNVLNVATSAQAIRRDLDMAFVIDTTSSMSDTATQKAVRASSAAFLNNFNVSSDRVALMHFATGTVVDVPFKSDQTRGFDRTTMTNLISKYSFTGNTASVDAMWNAKYQLDHVITQPSSLRVIVFFSDGAPNSFAASFGALTTCSQGSNTIKSGDAPPTATSYSNNPGAFADMTKQSTALSGATCNDAVADNVTAMPATYNVHAALDPDSTLPVITTSPRVVTSAMPTIGPIKNNKLTTAQLNNALIKYANVNNASRNLLEGMAAKARAEGVFVFALGYGPYLLTKTGAGSGELGSDILKCIANSPDAPSRCYNSNQPTGVYCYAATTDDLKPCYAQLASAILRIAK
jgi:hypothetical protein